jgi:hypothetical protein
MRVTVFKNEKESNERCITRFNKLVQASRKLVGLRSKRYHSQKPRKWQVRAGAVMRSYYRAIREKTKFH